MSLALVTDTSVLLTVYEGQEYSDLFHELYGFYPKWVPYSKPASSEYRQHFKTMYGKTLKTPQTMLTDLDGMERKKRLWMRNSQAN